MRHIELVFEVKFKMLQNYRFDAKIESNNFLSFKVLNGKSKCSFSNEAILAGNIYQTWLHKSFGVPSHHRQKSKMYLLTQKLPRNRRYLRTHNLLCQVDKHTQILSTQVFQRRLFFCRMCSVSCYIKNDVPWNMAVYSW